MKRVLLFLLCFVLALTLAAPLAARGAVPEEKVVRVGWYESAFHRTDQFGRRSGYGYVYQQRVATFTGWTYEYVEGSWSELLEKLIAGEIDLLSDVSYTEARAQKILYSAEAMGSEDYHAFISPDNTEISPDDFSTFNGKRVGVNKNSVQEQMFIDWAASHDVHPEIIELTEKTPELLEMLARGEIDVLVTLDTYGRKADVVPVCKVGAADSYFGINKNRPDLKQELDVAMNRILE
ncbi:MAG: transporter substrate-binding domain-containing protein, partial [Clostridia bacterium]|nr:transporter substrate-binding domain-containing protein [Clostridia bacterium]